MNRRLHLFVTAIFTALLFSDLTCEKDHLLMPAYKYEFAEKLNLNPYKKIYAVGDTINLEFTTANKRLFDKLTNQEISTDTTYLPIYFEYKKWYPHSTNVADTLTGIIGSNGSNGGLNFRQGINTLNFTTECDSNNYSVKLAFLTAVPGIYTIFLEPGISSCPNRSNQFPRSGFSFTFNLPDCNEDVYQTVPGYYRDTTYSRNVGEGYVFAFRVE